MQAAGDTGAPQPARQVDVKTGALPLLGDPNAKVTIVEFSDFECPFCEKYFSDAWPQIKKDYVDTGKVKISFRHFPLSFHPAALPAALAAECANEQGKFWEFHDKVFSNQSQISGGGDAANTALKQFAADLGLNTDQFNQCFDSKKYQENVTKDQNDGTTAGVSGTPTFYVNGKELVGAQPFSVFKTAIDEALNK